MSALLDDVTMPDLHVRCGAVPRRLDDATFVGPTWQVAGPSFLFHVPGIARFLVHDGREILMEPEAPATEADALPFLIGTGFGVVLHQRGCLVLHAAAVAFDGRAVALCGLPGAGKSTLAAALCRAGGTFVSDDLSVIRFDVDGRPSVLPDGRQHRLWADTIGRLSLADRQGPPVRDGIGKFYVDPVSAGTATPLAAVMVMREARPPLRPGVEPLALPDAAAALRKNVYRPAAARRMGLDARLFGQIAAVLPHIRVLSCGRTANLATLDDTVGAVLAHLRMVA